MNNSLSLLTIFVLLTVLNSCQPQAFDEPLVSFEKYKIENGFAISLAASEPFIEVPVTLDFDNQGRMWVVEMRSYMPNIEGTGEDRPNGRITILEDLDKDGITDHSKVFLDSLVLPRAISLVYGGLLYVEPPNLWFVEIDNDRPGKRTLVDSLYSDGGNVEMQPNGLVMDIDNWIYNAKSNYRYQLKNGQWKKEPATLRGQWGVARDNFGRLYYNNNTVQLIGDYTLPNTYIRNPYLVPKAAVNKVLTPDQRVYPLHATTVNRGGEKGILNKDSMLVAFTAACAPLIYRGDNFPDEYLENAFTCEPEANLVKRNLLTFDSVTTTARQAWENKEFLASTDESFRPVNLFNGPEGALYVLDMHRGVMQHKAYITPYYESHIIGKKMDTIMGMGRVLRIKNQHKSYSQIPKLGKASAAELVQLLKEPNGWTRDKAQQLLVFKNDHSVIKMLEALAKDHDNEIASLHALHTLDGLDALSFDLLQEVALSGTVQQVAHALTLLEKKASQEHAPAMAKIATALATGNNPVSRLYTALSLGPWVKYAPDEFLPVLGTISAAYPNRPVYQEAVVSSLDGFEEKFREIHASGAKTTDTIMNKLLDQCMLNRKEGNKNAIYQEVMSLGDERTNGLILFRNTCATCHGPSGNGIENLAPPLKGSQYVKGSVDKLGMIILHGLEGPIHVNGQLYELNGSMPGFANNFTDNQIADIISYLHNAFVTEPRSADPEKIKKLRTRRTGPLNEKELAEVPDTKD